MRFYLSIILLFSSFTSSQAQAIDKITTIDSSFQILDSTLAIKTTHTRYNDSYLGAVGKFEVYSKEANGKYRSIQIVDSLSAGFFFGLDTFLDFNSDGLKDLKIVYGTGARGVNVLDYIFLQKKSTEGQVYFKYLKGSDYPPNLRFDSTRNVIESMMFHGGTSFVDYKIVDDSLIQKGSVEVYGYNVWTVRSHYTIDKLGKRILQRTDSVKDFGEGAFSRESIID